MQNYEKVLNTNRHIHTFLYFCNKRAADSVWSLSLLITYHWGQARVIGLSAIEENLSAVIFWTHGEVNPIGGAALLLDEFIKHPAVFVGGVEQQTGAANHREIYFLSTSRSKKSRKKGQLGPASWPPWC